MSVLWNALFPPRCILCGRLIGSKNAAHLCDLCRWEDYRHPKPLGEENGRCSLVYEDRLQEAIYRMKYGGQKDYARILARWMAREGEDWVAKQDFSLVCSVPLAKARLRSRGFNQAELLARELCRLCRLPYADLLERTKNTKPQKGLGEAARRRNVSGVFAAQSLPEGALAQHICVVDDIYTTGSTVLACREAILQRFPQARVSFWALAGRMLGGFRQNF